jgi:hypothetical protein
MPLTLNAGLSKEINLPDGNLDVSRPIQIEIDVPTLRDVEDFERTVQEA